MCMNFAGMRPKEPRIQCATCQNEPVVIDILWRLCRDMKEFNERFGKYQDAAREYRCSDYLSERECRSKP